MKLRIRQKGRLKYPRYIPIYIPNRLILWMIRKKIPSYEMDTRKLLKLLRHYRGTTLLEFKEHRGEYYRVKL